ncbi:MAG: protein kinase [Chitinophaga sp.]|uniref:lanthionine synthetase LanC family protein n=1 Tax=Chitinophaga sp. TaxID=1869181 RepID=UPI0025C59403|nr:lanthionine synthetase LanC family protein [Chitinophaga sp.]MBV8253620.1 protein kinase [Chitinophaga sp.]
MSTQFNRIDIQQNTNIENYEQYIQKFNTPYQANGHTLKVGSSEVGYGWTLVLSSNQNELEILIQQIPPILINLKVAFEMPATRSQAFNILSGQFPEIFNRVITIYPDSEIICQSVIENIKSIVSDMRFTRIPNTLHLFNNLHIVLGYFNQVYTLGVNGMIDRVAILPNGGTLKINQEEDYQKSLKHYPSIFPPATIPEKIKKNISNQTLITREIKKNINGNVYQGFFIKKWYCIKKCIIKEGFKGDLLNINNKDAADNINWQYNIIKTLGNNDAFGEAYELVQEDLKSYIVVEFLNGKPLIEILNKTYQKHSWIKLERDVKIQLLTILSNAAQTIAEMHNKGIIHRDISPTNILIHTINKIKIIDFGLSYNLNDPIGSQSSFMGNTPGYRDPFNENNPVIYEDIYSLGALIIHVTTGIFPSFVISENEAILQKRLLYLTQSIEITNLIISCLSVNNNNRPNASKIALTLEYITINITKSNTDSKISTVENKNLTESIQKAISSLNHNPFTANSIWTSLPYQSNINSPTPQMQRIISPWLSSGISGIVISQLSNITKEEIEKDEDNYKCIKTNIDYLVNLTNNSSELPIGLFNGSYGIFMALYYATKLGFISPEQLGEFYTKTLQNKAINFGISNGSSGLGISLLHAKKYLTNNSIDQELSKIIEQTKSFLLKSNNSINLDLSISNGLSGITLFLIMYYNYTKDKNIESTIQTCIKSLMQRLHQKNNRSFINGKSGIAFTLLKAYSTLNNPTYKTAFIDIMQDVHMWSSRAILNYADGLAGIGHVFLDAYHTLQDTEWLCKTTEIINYLYLLQNDFPLSIWYNDAAKNVSADLMNGNGGILTLLKRYINIEKQTIHPIFELDGWSSTNMKFKH